MATGISVVGYQNLVTAQAGDVSWTLNLTALPWPSMTDYGYLAVVYLAGSDFYQGVGQKIWVAKTVGFLPSEVQKTSWGLWMNWRVAGLAWDAETYA